MRFSNGPIALVTLSLFGLGSLGAQAKTRSYIVSTTLAPKKGLLRFEVEELPHSRGTKLSSALLLPHRPRTARTTVIIGSDGEVERLETQHFPGLAFERRDGALLFPKNQLRLRHRTRLVLPAHSIVFQQASILALELVVRRLAAMKALRSFHGLLALPYVYPRLMTLSTLYVAFAGTQSLRLGGKVVTVQRFHAFSPSGGALLFVHEGQLVRAEVPLAGIWIRRADSEVLQIPSAPPIAGVERIEVTIPSKDATLSGTLTLPRGVKERLPALLLLSGSGPQDRNEDAPGLPLRLFYALAKRLTPLGFAVLRVDDRGVNKSTGTFANQPREVFTHDGIAMLDFLRAHPRVDPKRIWLLGHSEGTLHAARIAIRRGAQVKGVIALGAMGLQFVDTYFLQNILFGEGGIEEALQSAGLMFAMR
ncbi:MAG: alpha/beta fold hydrolase, partial [Myxococcales bacterium]|nr:alpha/beta fold hydrolase [Myxococcales bacterium]